MRSWTHLLMLALILALARSSFVTFAAASEEYEEGVQGEEEFSGDGIKFAGDNDFGEEGEEYELGEYELGDYSGEEFSPDAPIPGFRELDDTTFEKYVPTIGSGNKLPALVEFYAPWCGHCKELTPALEVFGYSLLRHYRVTLAKIDADKYQEIAEKHNVDSFPTIKWFNVDGSVENVEERSGAELTAFVEGRVGKACEVPALKTLLEDFCKHGTDKDEIIAKTKETLELLSAEEQYFGKIYLKVMKGISKKGAKYFKKEKKRLEKMLSEHVEIVSYDKLEEFGFKLEILTIFVKTYNDLFGYKKNGSAGDGEGEEIDMEGFGERLTAMMENPEMMGDFMLNSQAMKEDIASMMVDNPEDEKAEGEPTQAEVPTNEDERVEDVNEKEL